MSITKKAAMTTARGADDTPEDATPDDSAFEFQRARLNLPFYLYEGPDFDDGSWFEPCARGLRGEKVTEDQYAGEHYFLQQLRNHRWRVLEPMAALLFVVPLYVNAALQPSMQGASCNGTHYQELLDRTAAAVAKTPQYERHLGADHVLLCNSWKLAQKPPQQAPWSRLGQRSAEFFRTTFRNAIVGHMEAQHGADTGFWRCSVVSPYVANFDDAAFPRVHTLPPTAAERDVSFYFQGGANNRGTYGYAFRQAALAQLETLPRAHISAFSLPSGGVACRSPERGGPTSNCRSARSSPQFRDLMRRSRYNLVLRGDSPSSRRLYDGVAVGAMTVVVSDHLWTVGLPFPCLVPWRRFTFTLSERPFESTEGALSTLRALDSLSPNLLGRMQRVANRHRRDVLWNLNGSRVAENILITAALRCLPTHAKRGGGASIGGLGVGARSGAATAVLHAARQQLRQMCPYGDASVACRVPDATNCMGCETGDMAMGTPVEHCCGASCPSCNRSSRCVPPTVYFGDPLVSGPARRERLDAYLALKDKHLSAELQQWRAHAGKGKGSVASHGRTSQRGSAAGAARAKLQAAKQSKQAAKSSKQSAAT